jgi:hypothetical protein
MVHIHLRSNEEAAAAAAAAAAEAAGGSRKSCPCFRALPSCESERAGAQRQQEQEEAETAR